MPAEKSGQAYKFAKPFRGPYRVERTYENGADVRMLEKPGDKPIRVAFNRLRRCPKELSGPPEAEKPPTQSDNGLEPAAKSKATTPDSWTQRLRPRTRNDGPSVRTLLGKDGEL